MQVLTVGTGLIFGLTVCALGFLLALRPSRKLPGSSELPASFLEGSLCSAGLVVGGTLALISSWYLLCWFASLTTGRVLAPWDQWASFAPPVGTWQRQLNDFFGQDLSQRLLAMIIVAISAVLLARNVIRARSDGRMRVPLAFALTNLAFLLIAFLAIVPATRLPDLWLAQPRPPVDVGYYRTWLDALVTGMLVAMLFWSQGRLAKLLKWEK